MIPNRIVQILFQASRSSSINRFCVTSSNSSMAIGFDLSELEPGEVYKDTTLFPASKQPVAAISRKSLTYSSFLRRE